MTGDGNLLREDRRSARERADARRRRFYATAIKIAVDQTTTIATRAIQKRWLIPLFNQGGVAAWLPHVWKSNLPAPPFLAIKHVASSHTVMMVTVQLSRASHPRPSYPGALYRGGGRHSALALRRHCPSALRQNPC